jgi:hypothetical protein
LEALRASEKLDSPLHLIFFHDIVHQRRMSDDLAERAFALRIKSDCEVRGVNCGIS